MTEVKQKIRAIAFFLALFIPLLLFIPQTGYVDLSILNIEQRTPVPLPTLADTPLRAMPAAYEEYIGDRIPYRHTLIRVNAEVNLRVFGTIESTKVMLGEDGWLFSKNQPPENNQFDYQGLDHFTAQETAALQADFAALAQRCEEIGCELVLMIGPNKEGVYAGKMPGSVPVLNQTSRADALAEALSAAGLTVVWPQAELRQAAQSWQVYYKYDTHWNNIGAYVGTRALLLALGQTPPALSELAVTPTQGSVPIDLANLAGTYRLATDDVSYAVGYTPHVAEPLVAGDDFATPGAEDGRRMLMLRDSFATMMMPYVNRSFAAGRYLDLTTATWNDVVVAEPDILVLEVVERNLHELPGTVSRLLG